MQLEIPESHNAQRSNDVFSPPQGLPLEESWYQAHTAFTGHASLLLNNITHTMVPGLQRYNVGESMYRRVESYLSNVVGCTCGKPQWQHEQAHDRDDDCSWNARAVSEWGSRQTGHQASPSLNV